MKIYNEVILRWNEEIQQFDTAYEDSYEYDGPVDLLAHTVGEHTNVVHVGAFLSNSGYARNCEDGSGIGYHITDMGCPGNTPAEDYIGCICNRIYPDICVTESTCYLGDLNEQTGWRPANDTICYKWNVGGGDWNWTINTEYEGIFTLRVKQGET